MVNNAVPHVHQRKHYHPSSSQQGNIKHFLGQPKKAQSRRIRREKKAKRAFPRPVKALRPTVACPTVRYNMRKRLGRGFSVEEIRAAKINPRYAATIGIKVDARRRNVSEEGLTANTQRLRTYLSKLVLYPRSKKATQPGEATAAEIAANERQPAPKAAVIPTPPKVAPAPRKITKADTEKSAYAFLKKNISAVRFMGARIVRANKKKEAAAKKETDGAGGGASSGKKSK